MKLLQEFAPGHWARKCHINEVPGVYISGPVNTKDLADQGSVENNDTQK